MRTGADPAWLARLTAPGPCVKHSPETELFPSRPMPPRVDTLITPILRSSFAGDETRLSEEGNPMLRWPLGCAAAALLLMQSPLLAQVPGIPSVPGGAATSAIPGAAAPPAAPAAPTNNIWSMLCPTSAQMQACQQKLCNCSL